MYIALTTNIIVRSRPYFTQADISSPTRFLEKELLVCFLLNFG
jgi:hypothetical protein